MATAYLILDIFKTVVSGYNTRAQYFFRKTGASGDDTPHLRNNTNPQASSASSTSPTTAPPTTAPMMAPIDEDKGVDWEIGAGGAENVGAAAAVMLARIAVVQFSSPI